MKNKLIIRIIIISIFSLTNKLSYSMETGNNKENQDKPGWFSGNAISPSFYYNKLLNMFGWTSSYLNDWKKWFILDKNISEEDQNNLINSFVDLQKSMHDKSSNDKLENRSVNFQKKVSDIKSQVKMIDEEYKAIKEDLSNILDNIRKEKIGTENKLLDQEWLDNASIAITNKIAILEKLRERLSLLQVRLIENYPQTVKLTIQENFGKVKNFSALDVYPFLLAMNKKMKKNNYSNLEKIIKAPLIDLQNLIKALENDLKKLKQEQNSPEMSKLRQIEYLFRNEESKEQFDAFLRGPSSNGLESLQINDSTGAKMEEINDLLVYLGTIKAELNSLLKQINSSFVQII